VHHRLDIQALDEVFCQNVGGTDDNVVDMLAGQGHEHSFLDGHDGIVNTLVIPCHVVIPNAYVKEVPEIFCLLQPFQMPVVEKIEGS